MSVVPEYRGELVCRLWAYAGKDETHPHRHNYTISVARGGNDTAILSVGSDVHDRIQNTTNWKSMLVQLLCGRNHNTEPYLQFIRHHKALEGLRDLDFGYAMSKLTRPSEIFDYCLNGQGHLPIYEAETAFKLEEITADSLRNFIEMDLMRDYSPMHKFYFDYTLAALVVVLRDNKAGFAERFIQKMVTASSNHAMSREVAKTLKAANDAEQFIGRFKFPRG